MSWWPCGVGRCTAEPLLPSEKCWWRHGIIIFFFCFFPAGIPAGIPTGISARITTEIPAEITAEILAGYVKIPFVPLI